MKKSNVFQLIVGMFLVFGLHTSALAHTALSGSSPSKDSTVSSPSVMMLTFGGDVRLLRLSVTGSAGEVDIGFTPVAAASANFHLPMPFLQAGSYVVNWTAIGADGHSVSDEFSFSVDPNAPAAVMDHSHMEHSHDDAHSH